MKRKKLTRDSFAALKEHFPVISIEELAGIKGGSDCVLYCLAHIDGNHSAEWYGNMLMSFMGYTTTNNHCGNTGSNSTTNTASTAGICSSDIAALGSLGGLNVCEIPVGSSFSANPNTGKLSSGSSVIMIFNVGNTGHAVVVTGFKNGKIQYTDPYNHTSGEVNNDVNSYSTLYSVGHINNTSSSHGSINSGGYIYSW
jgi:hypothetical protein